MNSAMFLVHIEYKRLLYTYTSICLNPANMRRWPKVGLLLAHRRRHWPNSQSKLGQRLM